MLRTLDEYFEIFEELSYKLIPSNIELAKLFDDIHVNRFIDICFVTEMKSWFYFNEQKWQKDEGNLTAMEHCKCFVQALRQYSINRLREVLAEVEANTRFDTDENGESAEAKRLKKFIGFIACFDKRTQRVSLLADASSVNPKSIVEFDNNPHLFNGVNGTYDLKTFNYRNHSAADLITKISRVVFDENAVYPRFNQFINEVMCGDKGNARFLQKTCGSNISGEILHECLYVFLGLTTRNGKSTLTETVIHLMGDYAATVQPQTLGRRTSHGSYPTPDLARLKGIRFVNVPEPPKELIFDSALVKQLTGRDSITARMLRQNPIEFRPEFNMTINTNHRAKFSDNTVFLSKRVQIIPFLRHFNPDEQDDNLKNEFKKPKNISAIFNWLVEGYRMLVEEGLDVPEEVKKATDAECKNNVTTVDVVDIEGFCEKNLEASENFRTKTSVAYERYEEWAKENNFTAIRVQDFIAELKRCNYNIKRSGSNGNEIVGFKLTQKA